MSRGDTIAIDIVRRRLRAIEAVASHGKLTVRRVVIATAPEQLDMQDAEAVGPWVAEQLREAGIPRGRATFAIPREAVALKRMTLPSTDPVELPGMVELAMHRDLPFDAAEAVIDYLPVGENEGQTTVMAVAIPQPALDFVHQVAKAAGLKTHRISLRCLGTAALLRTMQHRRDHEGAWLGVDITHNGVELAVIDDGDIRFSRAAAVDHTGSDTEFTDAVVTETRRSWMSYRIVEDASGVDHAFVMGERQIARDAAKSIQEVIGVRAETVEAHPLIEGEDHELASTWPLAGLLLEPLIDAQTIDFNHPRKAPDRRAERRRLAALAAVFALIIMAGSWVLATIRLQNLRNDLADLTAEVNQQVPMFHEYEREYWRVRHLAQWKNAKVDWLNHLTFLESRLTDPSQVVLNEWSGSLRFNGVQYNRRAKEGERWSAPREITITLSGEARTRELADAFRESLVNTKEYSTRPTGPDTTGGSRLPQPSVPFKLTLRSTASTLPPQETPPVGNQANTQANGEGDGEADAAGEASPS